MHLGKFTKVTFRASVALVRTQLDTLITFKFTNNVLLTPADATQQLVKELTTSPKLQSNYQEKYCDDL